MPNDEAKPVAVLGTGIMGSAMARNLAAAGFRTTGWDAYAPAVDPLRAAGVTVAASVTDAVRDAGVVITMLPTSAAVDAVVFDRGMLEALAPRAVWAQMGTIGVRATTAIATQVGERRPDVLFVDAPVSGSRGPAEAGQLLILASGPDQAREIVAPAFGAIGSKTVWLGEAGQGSRLKLVVNAYLAMLVEGVAETLELAERFGVDSTAAGYLIEVGPHDTPFSDAKLHKMVTGDYAPEFPLEWAVKDLELALAEAGGKAPRVLSALAEEWQAAVDAGHGRDDVSVARLAVHDAL
jgi:3-hydroxyisobutyrate dehydrogenase